jgi:predicted phosphodiesterase
MNHAVISCLHANLAAVEAVLDDIDSQDIQTITCLGDLVGYGPQPNEVVELVRQRPLLDSRAADGGEQGLSG